MKRHIDADKLKTEINKAFGNLSKYNKESFADSPYTQGHLIGQKQAIEHILFIIDSLQQEQPEVDLEKEINNYHITKKPHVWFHTLDEIARHFYELGLNARNE